MGQQGPAPQELSAAPNQLNAVHSIAVGPCGDMGFGDSHHLPVVTATPATQGGGVWVMRAP